MSVIKTRGHQLFPVLDGTQIDTARRFASGPEREFAPGEIVYNAGERDVPAWLVLKGSIAVVRRDGLDHGKRERNEKLSGSICDALLAPTPGELTFEVARRNLAGGLSVTDDEAREAVRFAFRELKLVLEPGGAVSLAAILAGKIDLRGRTVAALLTGGNIDPAVFSDIIQDRRQAA